MNTDIIPTQLPAPTIDTPKGTRVAVETTIGRVPDMQRPLDCRYRPCTCGECDGTTLVVSGTYEGTVYWMDNSVEGTVKLDVPVGGQERKTIYFAAPRGDRCF